MFSSIEVAPTYFYGKAIFTENPRPEPYSSCLPASGRRTWHLACPHLLKP
uniref:Uncharacterized protein n=1 Tax=Arundo donax TaxID=35708 RepID=A0A0A9C4Q4_ARUDO